MIDEIELTDVVDWLKKNPKKSTYIGLAIVIGVAFFIRISNLPHLNDQLMGLDPYAFYRYSEYLVNRGYLPANDTMRYWPNGFDVFHEGILHSYVNAGAYLIANPIIGVSLMQVFQFYPAIFGAFSLIIFFFLVDEFLHDKKSALIATAFLAFIPAFLFRTSAGFADKEPIAVFLIFSTFLFFLKAIREEDKKKKYGFAVLSGLATGLCGMSWGGIIFAFESIAIYMIFQVLADRVDKEKFFVFVLWFLMIVPFFGFISHRYGGLEFVTMPMILPVELGIFLSFFHVYVYPRIRKKMPDSIPAGLWSVMLSSIVGVIISIVLLGPGYIINVFDWVQSTLLNPIGLSASVVAQSVAENQPPYFYGGSTNWWSSIGFVVFLFFGGTYLLGTEIFKDFKKKYLLSIGTAVFFMFLVFSRFSPDPVFSLWNNLFASAYVYALYIFALVLVFIYLKYPKTFKSMKSGPLMLFIYALLTVFAARGAVRNLFSAAPAICALAGFFVVKGYEEVKKATNDWVYGIPIYIIAIIIILSTMNQAYATVSQSFWTNIVDGWIPAFEWIRTQTPKDSVFLHWWDYGYWVQTLGNRTTVLDGGNYESPYKIARQFFTSSNMTEIRDILEYYGNPDYLLIVDDDIPKFFQIQRIAGRNVWFTPFYINQKIKNPFDDNYEFTYTLNPTTGTAPSFTDLTINNRLWASGETYVVNMIVPTYENQIFFNETYLYIANQRFGYMSMKINCVCKRGDECEQIRDDGYPACVVPVDQGAILVPEENKEMLFTKLYVFNQTVPGFETIYENNQAFNIQGILSQSQTHVQIWKMNYTEMGQ